MRFLLSAVAVALSLGAFCPFLLAQKPVAGSGDEGAEVERGAQDGEDVVAIRDCFAEYRRALLAGDGEAAADLLSQPTLAMYATARDLALSADRETMNEASIDVRMTALMLRAAVDAQELSEMDAKAVVAHAVDAGWIARTAVAGLSIGEVVVEDGHGRASILMQGDFTGINYDFYREEETWKFDLLEVSRMSADVIEMQIRQSGISEQQVLFSVLERLTGERADEEIWQAPMPDFVAE